MMKNIRAYTRNFKQSDLKNNAIIKDADKWRSSKARYNSYRYLAISKNLWISLFEDLDKPIYKGINSDTEYDSIIEQVCQGYERDTGTIWLSEIFEYMITIIKLNKDYTHKQANTIIDLIEGKDNTPCEEFDWIHADDRGAIDDMIITMKLNR